MCYRCIINPAHAFHGSLLAPGLAAPGLPSCCVSLAGSCTSLFSEPRAQVLFLHTALRPLSVPSSQLPSQAAAPSPGLCWNSGREPEALPHPAPLCVVRPARALLPTPGQGTSALTPRSQLRGAHRSACLWGLEPPALSEESRGQKEHRARTTRAAPTRCPHPKAGPRSRPPSEWGGTG